MPTTARHLVASLVLGASLFAAAPALAGPPPGPASFSAPAPQPEPTPQPPGPADLVAEPDVSTAPEVSLAGVGMQEGDALELTGIIFHGGLSGPCNEPVVLTYDIVGWEPDPATDDDFVAKHDAQVVIPPGETEFSLGTLITGDDVPEVDETLMARIHDAEGCAELPLGVVGAKGTILDDDVQLVSIDDVEVTEGDAGTTDMVFTVSLDAPALIDYSVSLDWGPGTATLGVDVVDDLPDLLVFLVGQQSHTVTVSVIGDTEVEADETLSVQLHSGSFGLDSVDAVGFGTIVDDDAIAMEAPAGEDVDDEAAPTPADDEDDTGDDTGTEVLDTAAERSTLPRTGVTVGVVALLGVALVAAGRAVLALTR